MTRPVPRPRAGGTEPRGRVRAEIQALRAVAVGLVVVYHLSPSAVPGGYVGVDVFFVVSGFLISRHLLKEALTTGRVDLAAFWAGRVRRILPAALVTTVVVVVAAVLLLPVTAAAEVGRTAVWAALSATNWLFAAHAVDYQAQAPGASPFEHFWSLGVEEQFYLVWPLLLLPVALLARRRGSAVHRWALVPFGVVLVASFAFGVWFTASGSPAAYFVTPTRMWELAAGGVLAAALADRQPRPAVAAALQVAGLATIVVGAFVLGPATPMPGVAALLPVAGAVAVLAGGDVPVLRRVWGFRPLRFVGDASYSIYLWHWPVIVFTRALTHRPLDLVSGAAVLAGSLLLATASYRFVERPIRRVPIRRPLRIVAAGAAAIAVALAVSVVPIAGEQVATARGVPAREAVLDPSAGPAIGYPQLTPAADRTWARKQHVVVPDPAALAKDLAFGSCTIEPLSTTSPVCVRGDTTSRITIALVGDSHMRQWAASLDRLAQRHHWRIVTILHNSCPFSLLRRPLEIDGQSHCTDAVRWALPVLKAQHVQVVVTSAYRRSYPVKQASAAADAYAAMWRTLQQDGIPVVALGDTPTPPTDPIDVDCIAAGHPAACGLLRTEAEAVPDPLRAAAARTNGVGYVDPVSAFCGSSWCPGVIGNVGVYVDDNHASDTYLMSAMPWIEQRLAPAIRTALARR